MTEASVELGSAFTDIRIWIVLLGPVQGLVALLTRVDVQFVESLEVGHPPPEVSLKQIILGYDISFCDFLPTLEPFQAKLGKALAGRF